MQENPAHPQRVCNQAGMLTSGTTKAVQGVFGDVITTLHRNLFNGISHVDNSNLKKPLGNLFAERTGVAVAAAMSAASCANFSRTTSASRG